jgi:hypothetical protein
MDSQNQLDIWDGEYSLKLTKVDWSYSGGVLTPTDDNGANAKFSSSDAGQFKISGTPNFSVKPLDCDEVDMALNPGEASVKVLGSLIGIRVDNTLSDHLKRIRYATDPENDIYDDSNNRIWDRTETQPLVVACNSTITLIPEFEGQKKLKVRDGVTFQWFDSDGLLALSGNTDLDDEIYFPTPTVIDKYTLRLGFNIVGESIEIPETYAMKRIVGNSDYVSKQVNSVYYMKCIEDSVVALKTYNSSTPDYDMVNKFYAWWWKLYPSINELKYGVTAFNTSDVINKQGGMCQGLGNYFAKCLECQGVSGLHRIAFQLNNIRMSVTRIPGTDIGHFPYLHEYWGAIFINNLGLNNEKAVFWVPNNEPDSITPYMREALRVYQGKQKVPPADLKNVIVDMESNVVVKERSEGFCFRAPDGHALIFYKDEDSGRVHLLDPSFYHKRTMIELSDLPPIGNILIIDVDPNPRLKEFLEYLNYFSYFRGNTAFKSSNIMAGMAIFDFKIEQMNYLRADFNYYYSKEENTQ